MIHIDPVTETTSTQDHCINIIAQPDGIHVSMTDNVAEVIKYPDGGIKVISKQDTEEKPYWLFSEHNGRISMVNGFTGQREEFNTAWAWEESAKAAGIPIKERG